VRAFAELTGRGQLRRLRMLALGALRRHEREARRCSFVAQSFNTIFRIETEAAAACALRVGPAERIHAEGSETAEAAWLTALRRDGLAVAEMIPAPDGSVVVEVASPGVPEPRSCVLLGWVRGRPLSERMSAESVRRAGRLAALVHEHGATDGPAAPPGVLVADRVLHWRAPPRLAELSSTYGAVLTDALERAQQTIDELWRHPPHPPHLLHGDLSPDNVVVARHELTLVDFQDLIWGFDVQDLAIAAKALHRYDEPTALLEAFRLGYEDVRRWPDDDPDTFAGLVAARRLHQLNLGLHLRRPGLEGFVARQAALITAWMDPSSPQAPSPQTVRST